MTKSETVRARVDTRIRDEAQAVIESLGLTISDAIRIFLIRVAAEKAIPFDMNERPGSRATGDAVEGRESQDPNGPGPFHTNR